MSTTKRTRLERSSELAERVVLMILHLRAPGNYRKVKDKSIIATDADRARLNVTKRLIDAPEHSALIKLGGAVRWYVGCRALPGPFQDGVHALPITLLEEVDARMNLFIEEQRALVETLKSSYARIVDRSRAELGQHFQEKDYLTPTELDSAYAIQWQYITLSAPTSLQSIDSALYQREQKRIAAQWDEALIEMRDALRTGLAELVNDMVRRLSAASGEDGKRFKPSALLLRFDEFLTTVDKRNVTDDAQLTALTSAARKLLNGVSAEQLVSSRSTQRAVTDGFKQVQRVLSKLETESSSRRRITFTDE